MEREDENEKRIRGRRMRLGSRRMKKSGRRSRKRTKRPVDWRCSGDYVVMVTQGIQLLKLMFSVTLDLAKQDFGEIRKVIAVVKPRMLAMILMVMMV